MRQSGDVGRPEALASQGGYDGSVSETPEPNEDMPKLKGRSHLPAVCLDIDGVLNPWLGPESEGFEAHHLHVPASDLPQGSPFLRGHGREDLEMDVFVSREHGRWLNALAEKADIYWATTWETAANLHYGPLLGIGLLETIPHSWWMPTFSDVKNGDVGHWKREALRDLFADRPLVWIDDFAYDEGLEFWRGSAPTLVIVPDGTIGLTREQMEQVDQFIDGLAISLD